MVYFLSMTIDDKMNNIVKKKYMFFNLKDRLNYKLQKLNNIRPWSNRNPLYGILSLPVLNNMFNKCMEIYNNWLIGKKTSNKQINFLRIFRLTVLYYSTHPNEVRCFFFK